MRVLFADVIKSEIGGGHIVLARLANYFFRHFDYKIQPLVLLNDVQNFRRRFLDEGVEFIPFGGESTILSLSRVLAISSLLKTGGMPIFTLFAFWPRLIKMLKVNRIDLIHANSMTAFLALSLPAKFCKIKLIYHLHDSLLSAKKGGTMSVTVQRWLLFWMKRFADRIIAVSNFVARSITSKEPLLQSKICILHNGLELAKTRQLQLKIYKGGYPLLAAFGRLDSSKGFDIAIKAVAILKEKYGCQAKLRIIGDGPQRKELEDLIEREKLGQQVELWGFRDNVFEYVAEADIVIVPSVWEEPFPLAVIEAMANSKIVIASKVGGIPEMISDGVEGILISKASPELIAERVVWVMEHADEANKMAQRAELKVTKEFSLEKMAQKLLKIYKSI